MNTATTSIGGCAAAVESRLSAGLSDLDNQAGQLGCMVNRLERIAGRIAGFDPKPPQDNSKAAGPQPVDSHLAKFQRTYAAINESLKAFERELCKLEENVG